MFVPLVLLLLASVSSSQKPVNNNQQIDNFLKWHNALLTRAGYDVVQIAPLNLDVISFENGYQFGMNTLVRKGDSLAWRVGNNSVYYSNRLGYGLLTYAFGNITFESETFAGVFHVKENEFLFDYVVTNETGVCSVILNDYRYTDFGDLEFFGSSKRFENLDLEDIFGDEEDLLLLANGYLSLDRKPLEAHIQGICQRPLPELSSLPEAEEA